MRERAQHKAGIEQEQEAVRRLAALQAIGEMWPQMDIGLWQRYSRLLTEVRRETEEKRLAFLVSTETQMLQAMPRVHLSAHWWLPEDEATTSEPERHTDEVEVSPYATQRLSTAWFIETEKRAAVLVKSE